MQTGIDLVNEQEPVRCSDEREREREQPAHAVATASERHSLPTRAKPDQNTSSFRRSAKDALRQEMNRFEVVIEDLHRVDDICLAPVGEHFIPRAAHGFGI